MSNWEMFKKARDVEISMTGRRHCSQCYQQKDVTGGRWKTTNKGLNRRWECRQCYEKRLEREGND